MNLKEFAQFVVERVKEQYGKVTERNIIEYLENNTFLSNDEIMMVLNKISENRNI